MDDARFMQLALDQGFITTAQVDRAKEEQQTLADRGVQASLWFLLQDLGYVTEEQARRLRKNVSSSQLRALEVDGYVIQGRLGAGGMGDVFRAQNAQGQQAAVKLLSAKFSTNAEYVRRFEREARASERLQHPNICHGIRHGEVAGHRFLLMELVDGPSLKARLQDQGPLDERSALTLLQQMAEALGHAWGHGVLHRDVKPANILMGPPRPGVDEPFCAKLCDFGLAKVWQDGASHDEEDSRGGLTGAGLALGTPHYMSPEQASGAKDLDQRCDIYGLGATLYHALLGHTMYSGKSSAVIMYKQVTEQIDLNALRLKGTRDRLVALLERMLAKDKTKRIATWEAVLAEVAAIRGKLESSVAGHNERPSWWVPAGLAAAAVVALALGVLVLRPPAIPTATPESLRAILAEASASGRTVVRLSPGTYLGPFTFSAIHAGLTLEAAGSGVVIASPATAVRVEAGARELRLRGMTIQGVPAVVTAGGGLTLEEVVCESVTGPAVLLQGGGAQIHGGRVQGGLQVDRRAQLTLTGVRIAGPLTITDADVQATATDIEGVVSASLGRLSFIRSRVAAPGAPIAMVLERGATLEADDLVVEGAHIGIAAQVAFAPRLERVRIAARDQGMRWNGPVDPGWSWQHMSVTAPVSGIPPGLHRP